ncbi:hypothetical protein M405DRAFT_884800 [Rhizopogon salebrosus TDB-379]|nr:hypothetical protein M405DRAFT_884800 [Rhizopogon salebrosus TDB-379]
MADTDFINLMTPYFARHQAIRDGMLELRALFLGPMEQCPDGYRRRQVPAQPVTYHKMLSILRRICDTIPHTEDPYPDEKFCLNARNWYRCSLELGNRMPLMAEEGEEEAEDEAEEDEEVTTVRSNKRAFSEPDGLQYKSKGNSKKDKGISLETLERSTTVLAYESTTLGFLMYFARSLTRSSHRVTYNSCTEVIGFGPFG